MQVVKLQAKFMLETCIFGTGSVPEASINENVQILADFHFLQLLKKPLSVVKRLLNSKEFSGQELKLSFACTNNLPNCQTFAAITCSVNFVNPSAAAEMSYQELKVFLRI